MSNTVGVRFLNSFTLGNYNLNNPGANIISVTSQSSGDHIPEYLTTTPLRETYRTATAATMQSIVIKTDDTTTVPDCFAILNHNFSETAVVTLQGSQTIDFTTPAFSIPFSYNEGNMVLVQNTGIAYNYYRIQILDPQNTCGFLEIGRIIGGQSFYFQNNEDLTDDISITPVDKAYTSQTEGFFKASAETVQVDTVDLAFSKIDTTPGSNQNYLGVKAMLQQVGVTYPFLTIVDPNDQYFEAVWGQLSKLPQFKFTILRYVSFNLTIQQVF